MTLRPASLYMRKVRFEDPSGTVVTGTWDDSGINYAGERYDPESVDIQFPGSPTKIIGVGPNFVSNIEGKDKEWPESPKDLLVFVKTAPNSLVHHGKTAALSGEGEYYHELELGIVIGEQCRQVAAEDASSVIEGFTCVNEITNKEVPESKFDPRKWVRAKSFDNSAPVGPAVATDIPDDASMELRVNGEIRQKTDRTEQIFSDGELIEEITKYLTLEPGDIIATGSPIGVSELEDGDQVEVEIEGIGTLEHTVEITA